MEELFEELKHHRLEKVHFQVNRYEVILLDGQTISSGTCEDLLKVLRALRTASNHDARADDSDGVAVLSNILTVYVARGLV